MKYLFEVTETLTRTVEIEAGSHEEAYEIGRKMYRAEEIVLDASDLFKVDFETFEYPEPKENNEQ